MTPDSNLDILKNILENSLHPELLDSHSWVESLNVLDAVANNPDLQDKSPGQKLVFAVENLFCELIIEAKLPLVL